MGDRGAYIMGPRNVPIERQNPDSLIAPAPRRHGAGFQVAFRVVAQPSPPELIRAHLNFEQQTLAALHKDKPFIVTSQRQYPKRKPLPEWPGKTMLDCLRN